MFVLNTCHSKENEKIWIRNTENTEYPLHPQLRILRFSNFKVNCFFSAGHGIYLYINMYLIHPTTGQFLDPHHVNYLLKPYKS